MGHIVGQGLASLEKKRKRKKNRPDQTNRIEYESKMNICVIL